MRAAAKEETKGIVAGAGKRSGEEDEILMHWSAEDKNLYDCGFRKHCGNLRMIANGIPSKSVQVRKRGWRESESGEQSEGGETARAASEARL